MAAPVSFPEQNWELKKPADMTDEECSSLPCFVDERQVVSSWELSDDEVTEIVRTRRVWLGVVGQGQPPVWVTGTNPFQRPGDANEQLGFTQG